MIGMSRRIDLLWTDLEHTLRDLGAHGGLMSPSVYDTAQCLRYDPPPNVWPVVEWLLGQQQPDGGWGSPAAPRARYMPTLATLLALAALPSKRKPTVVAIQSGLSFIRRNQWHDWSSLGNDLPGGAELILPSMLAEAAALGLRIDPEPYIELAALGERRRALIKRLPRLEGTTAAHVWEGWGGSAALNLVDGSKTVGHSPTASAAWLRLARGQPGLEAACAQVEEGLREAWNATTTGIEGVINSCWPITHFERAFALYPLLLAEVVAPAGADAIPPSLRRAIGEQLALLRAALTPAGIGFSDWFLPDGDDTAVTLALLAASGDPPACAPLLRFKAPGGDHFCAWQGELQSSPSVTAHALHALALLPDADEPLAVYQADLLRQRLPSGLWAGEKWNASPIYATSQILIAFLVTERDDVIPSICHALAQYQHANGAWGMHEPSAEETGYAALALLMAKRRQRLPEELRGALAEAKRWMCAEYRPFEPDGVPLWLGKETYRPLRVARSFEIMGLLALLQDDSL